MKTILRILAGLLLFIGQPAWAGDEGKVILAISAGPETNLLDYFLRFHSKDGKHSDYVHYGQHGLFFLTSRDFDDAQGNGVVRVLELAPGEWEIDGFGFAEYGAVISPRLQFAIPFTVKAGKTIYIGDYRVHVDDTVVEPDPNTISVFFSVSDQSARDIPIAQKDDDEIKDVEVALPVIPPHTPYFAPRPPVVDQPTSGIGAGAGAPSHPE